MKLSIIIAAYNPGNDLQITLDSVLSQNMKDYEIVLIDGLSDCEITRRIISQYRESLSIYVSEKDLGIYDAMNKGINLASGEYLTFLNCGDTYCNSYILSSVFQKNSGDLIYGDVVVQDVNGSFVCEQKSKKFNLFNLLVFGTRVVCHQAIFIKKKITPYYDLKFKYKAELNWYFDIVERVKISDVLLISAPVVNYKLGGFGYINYRENQAEKRKLILSRYGPLYFLLCLPVMLYGLQKNRNSVKDDK